MYGDFLIWFINWHEEFQSVTCDMTEKWGFPSCELSHFYYDKIHKLEDHDAVILFLEEFCPTKKFAFKLFNGNSGKGHMVPPLEDISRINVTMEEQGIWYKIFKERFFMTRKERMKHRPLTNKSGIPWDEDIEIHEVQKEFPSSELTFRIDKFLNYDETEYDKLLDYIDSPKIPYWDRRITEFRTHLGVTLGET